MTNLCHRASFHSKERIAPSNRGIKHLAYGILQIGARGWGDPVTLGALASGAEIIAAFIWHEAHTPQPIMPLRLLASRVRVGAYAARFLYLDAMVGFFFFSTQIMQRMDGFSAFQAGLGFLPMTLVNFAVAMTVPRLVIRIGGPRLLLLGIGVTFVGMLWLSRVDTGSGYALGIALPMVLIGAGQGFCFGPMTATGIADPDKRDAGVATGLVNVAHQIGMSFGLGLLVASAALATPGMPEGQSIWPERSTRPAFGADSMLLLLVFVATFVLMPHRVNVLHMSD